MRVILPPFYNPISIHALREEGDSTDAGPKSSAGEISIHALREEGDFGGLSSAGRDMDFYPRPPRGGRRVPGMRKDQPVHISIHALREEGDPPASQTPPGWTAISIHALREEGDVESSATEAEEVPLFLSTPSARRATDDKLFRKIKTLLFLSTPSARRATAATLTLRAQIENFYPRPPRGGRPCAGQFPADRVNFYPRPPRGGRPNLYMGKENNIDISIHALREEGDARS